MSYNPLAGKFGRIKANNTTTNLTEHELRLSAEDIDTSHFESDVGADTTSVFTEGITGMVEGDIMVRGLWDGANPPHLTPFFLFPGYFGTVFLGLAKTYGFTCAYRCLQTPISTAARNKAASFEARLKSNGVITMPTTTWPT